MGQNFYIYDVTVRESQWKTEHIADSHIRDEVVYAQEAGIDYVNLGFLYNGKHENLSAINGLCELKQRMKGRNSASFFVVDVDIFNHPLPVYNYKKIIEENRRLIINIRFRRKDIKAAQRYYEEIRRVGIPTMISPLRCEDYSLKEFQTMVDWVWKDAYAFFVDDADGTMTYQKVEPYFEILRAYTPLDTRLGLSARQNTKEIVKKLMDSNLNGNYIITSSICGVSKYLDLYRTENACKLLNSKYGTKYNISALAFMRDYYISYYVAGAERLSITDYAWSSIAEKRYIHYYRAIGLQDWEILECLRNNTSSCFSPTYAERLLKNVRCSYWKQKMCILVPTCNRPETIQFWLERTGKRLFEYGVDLIIYDSSDDDNTQRRVKQFSKKGYSNIKYVKYTGFYDGRSLDHKLIEAYKEYANQYEYIWICRDGIAVEWDYVHSRLKKLFDDRNDLIVVDSDWRDIWGTGNRQYHNAVKLFQDQCIRMVTLGTMIVNSRFMMRVIEEIPIDDSNYSLWQMVAIFQYYARHRIMAASYTGNVFVYNPMGTISSFWNSNGKALWQWAERWYIVVDSLPKMYDKAKKNVYKIDMYDFHPFSMHTLLLIKSNNGLRIKDVVHYQKYFRYIHDRPIWQYYILALLPIPHKMLKGIIMHPNGIPYRIMKKTLDIARTIYHGRSE